VPHIGLTLRTRSAPTIRQQPGSRTLRSAEIVSRHGDTRAWCRSGTPASEILGTGGRPIIAFRPGTVRVLSPRCIALWAWSWFLERSSTRIGGAGQTSRARRPAGDCHAWDVGMRRSRT